MADVRAFRRWWRHEDAIGRAVVIGCWVVIVAVTYIGWRYG